MKIQCLYRLTLVSALLIAPPTISAIVTQPEQPGGLTASGDPQAGLYAEGTQAINQSRWQDAVNIFDKVAQQHGEYAEGALYWKAYAENQQGQSARALETCSELRHIYPKSRWLEECGALEIEIRGKSGDPVAPQAEQNTDLKLLALNALMQQDQAQALPAIQRLLASDQPEEVKTRALFILAQSQSAEAQALIGRIAQGEFGPALQIKAIRMFAAERGKQSLAALSEIYKDTTDDGVKKAILQSYLITGSSDKLLDAARQETNPQLARAAVQSLGAMGASRDLLTLYRDTNSGETKSNIINALIAAGHNGVSALTQIAASEQNPELRRKAIRNLGLSGGAAAAPSLMATYQKNSDRETKRAVAQALFLAGDAHDLITLASAEKDPEMKQYLIQQLSLMHSKEATQYMVELLNK